MQNIPVGIRRIKHALQPLRRFAINFARAEISQRHMRREPVPERHRFLHPLIHLHQRPAVVFIDRFKDKHDA